jgi:hypothetical protein
LLSSAVRVYLSAKAQYDDKFRTLIDAILPFMLPWKENVACPYKQQDFKMDDELIKKKDEEMKSMATAIKQLSEKVATARMALQNIPKPSAEQEFWYQELIMLRSIRDDVLVLFFYYYFFFSIN